MIFILLNFLQGTLPLLDIREKAGLGQPEATSVFYIHSIIFTVLALSCTRIVQFKGLLMSNELCPLVVFLSLQLLLFCYCIYTVYRIKTYL